jgi:hypothetical protein
MNLAARSPWVAARASGVFEAPHPAQTRVCHKVSADPPIRDVRIPGRRPTAAKHYVVREHPHDEPDADRNNDWSAS